MATTRSIDYTVNHRPSSNLAVQLARFREIGIVIFLVLVMVGATIFEPRFLRSIFAQSYYGCHY